MVLQRQGTEKLEEELGGKISSEKKNVQSLKDEVRQVNNLSHFLHATSLIELRRITLMAQLCNSTQGMFLQ